MPRQAEKGIMTTDENAASRRPDAAQEDMDSGDTP
jgi:hypothetical protein